MSDYKLSKPIFHKGHMCYRLKNKDGKYDFVRADKLVYTTFVDKSLDVMEDSWDLEHIDGDWKNCKDTNLRLKKQVQNEY